MGIFIFLAISKSVTKEEWEKVYEETLELVKKIPLADSTVEMIHGIRVRCLTRTKEKSERYGWNNDKVWTGWSTVGNYNDLTHAEEYSLSKNLVADKSFDPDSGDPLCAIVAEQYEDELSPNAAKPSCYRLWGSKTQGESYHTLLLIVAALIETRLGEKAFTYGDVTRGQFQKAVDLATQYFPELGIRMPASCDAEAFSKRVTKLSFSEKMKFNIFDEYYLGKKDAEYGRHLREAFSENVLDEMWKMRFGEEEIGSRRFARQLKNYLLWGFDLGRLCDYANLTGEGACEKFVNRIMDTKMHVKEKNTNDMLEIDRDEPEPYSIWTLFAQFGFAGAENKKVDRYMPIDEIRRILREKIGNQCPVDDLVDKYLAKENATGPIDLSSDDVTEEEAEAAARQDPAEVFDQLMGKRKAEYQETLEKYDIAIPQQMIFYEPGDTIDPTNAEYLAQMRHFLDKICHKDPYPSLMSSDPQARCQWLVEHNESYIIRDKDWEHIFEKIEASPDAFQRYYPLFRLAMNSDTIIYLSKAMLINDALYIYSGELAEKYPEKVE